MSAPLRFHPLADALFRVDAWHGRDVLCLFVGNVKYRQGRGFGRKTPVEDILDGAVPDFAFKQVELTPAERFGKVKLVSAEAINRLGRELSGALRDS